MGVLKFVGIALLIIMIVLTLKFGFRFIMAIINFLFRNIFWVIIALFIIGIIVF